MATVSSNELNSKLYDAAEAGDNAAVIAAIAAGADVNWKNEDDDFETPLYKACWSGRDRAVLILLEHGANPNIQIEGGCTSLHIACEKGHENIVLVLLQNGANPNLQDERYGEAPLHKACYYGYENIVLVMFEKGANPNLQNQDGWTPLYWASFRGHENIVLVLLQNKADPNLQNKDGQTPLLIACENGHENIVLVLLENKANPKLKDEDSYTPLHRACQRKGNDSTVLALLQKGADPNLQNKDGYTPLHIACEKGYENTVLVLLQNKANPNLQNKAGKAALNIACGKGYWNIAEFLLINGANTIDEDGKTALSLIIKHDKQDMLEKAMVIRSKLHFKRLFMGEIGQIDAALAAKWIADDSLYEEYSNLKSDIYAFRYTDATQSDRDTLINRIKSFVESNSLVQHKVLNEKGDIEGLKLFIGVLFEFKVALEMISISNGQEQQSQTVSKFEATNMVFGDDSDFKDGLNKKIRSLYRSMEEECYLNDDGKWKKHFDYIVYQPAFEWVEDPFTPHRVRDKGHNGWTLDMFVNHDIARKAKLSSAEVASLRLYTGPLYAPWNTALRNSKVNLSSLEQWGTCISVLYSAIFKLSFLSEKATVYRGVNESRFKLPDSFTDHKGGKQFAGGVELAFMSTSTDINVAAEYAKRGTDPSNCSIFEIPFDAGSRGANVQWVSQYSYECELIYPPCTYLTCENVTIQKEGNLAGIRCLSVRATVSTARKEVDSIRTVKDKPHEDTSRQDYAHASSEYDTALETESIKTATQFRMGTMSKMGVNVLKTGKVNCFDAIDMMEILSILAAYEFLNIEAALNMAIKENNDDGESIVMLAKCQYKDIPVWSVSVGLPKDLVTYLLKIRYNKLQ